MGKAMSGIHRLLIANRGEIASRIIATCHRMGIDTVALAAPGDETLPYAAQATYCHLLSGATLAETYLNIPAIIQAAKQHKADAIHPGYGFLSENAAFAEAVKKAGLIWVGPPAKSIRAMGSKAAARQCATKLGIPVVPGYDGEAQDEKTLLKEAARIGFPLLVKAAAGGGGKGMRVVEEKSALATAIALAKSESKTSFGDDRLILERYLTRPRHIEIQLMADTHGTVLAIGARDCSIQRRHQKVLEESPAPNLPATMLAEMESAAIRLAKNIGYTGAGTIELMLEESSGEWFFLEMNTRLQVEHPVTELVHGLDLVAMQLAVASGEKLPKTIPPARGHAIEARLCAEDPDAGFLPSTGMIEHLVLPNLPGIRYDVGYAAGHAITPQYDPMIGKIIAYGTTREEARQRLLHALRSIIMVGPATNRDYLCRLLAHPAFAKAKLSTGFITEHEKKLTRPPLSQSQRAALLAAHLLSDASPGAVGAAHTTQHTVWQQIGKLHG
ncbi:ATP-grasp domain-containing protein [bacterium]|nr:ATP-grasp domain-containing protein [bacterium]